MSNQPLPPQPNNSTSNNGHDDLIQIFSDLKMTSSYDDPGYAGLCSLMNSALKFMQVNPSPEDQAAMFSKIADQISNLNIKDGSEKSDTSDGASFPVAPAIPECSFDKTQTQTSCSWSVDVGGGQSNNEEVFLTPRGEVPTDINNQGFSSPFTQYVPPVPESAKVFHFGSGESSKSTKTPVSDARKFQIPFHLPANTPPAPDCTVNKTPLQTRYYSQDFPPVPDCSFDESPERVQTSFEASRFSLGTANKHPHTISKKGKMRRKMSLSAQRPLKDNSKSTFQQPQTFPFSNLSFNVGTSNNNSMPNVNLHPSGHASSPESMDISPHPSGPCKPDPESKINFDFPTFNLGTNKTKGFTLGTAGNDPPSPSGRKPVRAIRRTKYTNKIASPIFKETKKENKDQDDQKEEVDYSGRRARVESLKEEAGNHYAAKRYVESSCSYTYAINAHTIEGRSVSDSDSLLSMLYGNRAAALLMCNAYSLAAQDGEKALKYLSETLSYQSLNQIQNVSKIQCRLARAYLKYGELEKSRTRFNASIAKVNYGLKKYSLLCSTDDSIINALEQTKTSAEIGINTISRMEKLLASFKSLSDANGSLDKQLSIVREMLSISPGSLSVFQKEIELFISWNRWEEVIKAAEKYTCTIVRIENVYVMDLASSNPFPNAPAASHLKCNSFEDDTKEFILDKNASSEAILRMPDYLRHIYLRALRLEEKYDHAESAICALEKSKTYYAKYVTQERDLLRRTRKSKSDGDDLFRKGEYDLAASRYNVCLKIDSNSNRISSSGGRLHAILHCNRAACFMAVNKYRDAARECTAALRIHSNYARAMARRARCYLKLKRFTEAIDDFDRCVETLTSDRKTFDYSLKAADKIDGIRDELKQTKQAQRDHVKAETAKAEKSRQRKEQQRWYDENVNSSSKHRWDEWRGGGSKSSHGPFGSGSDWNAGGSPKSPRSRHQNNSKGWKESSRRSNNSRSNQYRVNDRISCHYSTLSVSADAEHGVIKKSYHKLALRYHPDKNKDPDAAALFRKVQAAYEVLGDAEARAEYDRGRRFL